MPVLWCTGCRGKTAGRTQADYSQAYPMIFRLFCNAATRLLTRCSSNVWVALMQDLLPDARFHRIPRVSYMKVYLVHMCFSPFQQQRAVLICLVAVSHWHHKGGKKATKWLEHWLHWSVPKHLKCLITKQPPLLRCHVIPLNPLTTSLPRRIVGVRAS